MSGTTTSVREPAGSHRPVRRVRHEVRDGIAVMAFSAVVSSALAAVLTVLAHVGN